jgi:lysophospholipase L1-like esterase
LFVADVVLLMAGTNDFFYDTNVTTALLRMDALLNILFNSSDSPPRVLVSGVTHINATRCAKYSSAPVCVIHCLLAHVAT